MMGGCLRPWTSASRRAYLAHAATGGASSDALDLTKLFKHKYFVTAQHAKSIPLNQSWLYNSLGKLIGGGETKPASPWGQQKTPAANLSVSLR